MRRSIAFGLMLLVPTARAADVPIPQDPARMEKLSRARPEWNRATMNRPYEEIGKKDPRWDEPARRALEQASLMFAQQYEKSVILSDIFAPAKQAVDAGCDDPMVVYLHVRTSVGPNFPGAEEHTRRMRAAAAALVGSAYPPCRRASVLMRLAELGTGAGKPAPEERAETERHVDAAIDLMRESAAKDPRGVPWDEFWYRLINDAIGRHRTLTGDYKAAFDRVDARLEKVEGIESLRLALKGNFLLMWGWEARTNAVAAAITERQMRTCFERLEQARDVLQEAWKRNHDQPNVARLLVEIDKGIGGDRPTMEGWFERAMEADGDDYFACWAKLDWLDPKWHGGGSTEDMLAFGHACAATKNWHTGIILLAATAHLRHMSYLPIAEKSKYIGSPDVWNEIQAVYDDYLKHYPDDAVQRTKYAMFCHIANRQEEADVQFRLLGDKLSTWTDAPNFSLDTLKRARDKSARAAEMIRQQKTK